MTDKKIKRRCQVCGRYTDNLKETKNDYLGIVGYSCEDCYKKRKQV